FKPDLLTDDDEMREMRRGLIIQRKKIKKGIDFNNLSLELSKNEIEGIVREYPRFSGEILAIVSEYEENP
ncbi:MAG: hypothetical protein IKT17_00695, partial [Lachnospiraceae bacterium]|nr:hypothetical protein [Lachnospiraceae bacterium]